MGGKKRLLTSIRKRFVGITTPTPTELRNDSVNIRKEKFRYAFSVSFSTFPADTKKCPWIPFALNHFDGKSKEKSANTARARSPPR
jgi:hypothetical protein